MFALSLIFLYINHCVIDSNYRRGRFSLVDVI